MEYQTTVMLFKGEMLSCFTLTLVHMKMLVQVVLYSDI